MRPATVFLSSTFLDLDLERRFVRDLLTRRGFGVVLEQDCLPEFDWYQWSMNEALRCDIYLQMFTERLGTPGILKSSIVNDEAVQARGAALCLSYELKRPFPDQERLFRSVADEGRYQRSLAHGLDHLNWDAERAMYERMSRSGRTISSVAELEAAIEKDVRISAWKLMKHRLSVWYRCYFDTNLAGWRRARDDESLEQSASRVAVLKRLRLPIVLTAIAIGVVLWVVRPSVPDLLLILGSVALASGLIAWATLPSYLWIGKQTIVGRGLFGVITKQQSRTEPLEVMARWQLFHRWLDVSAVSVRFADGRGIFVPFIRNALDLARLAAQPPPPRRVRDAEPPDPPEVVEARLRAFVKELEDEERQHRDV